MAEPYWDDAKLAVQEIGQWIRNADTKVTILAAALGVLISSLASKGDLVAAVFMKDTGCIKLVVGVVLLAWLLTAVMTVLRIYSALQPRTHSSSVGLNRFAWPVLAKLEVAPRDLSQDALAGEAWTQAYDLAKIAAAKYSDFKFALRWFIASLGVGVLLIFVVLAVDASKLN